MPHARINGIDIYFERHGDAGDPLVFIHGHCGETPDWRFQIEAFAPTNRVLVMDNRGHGKSEAPKDRTAYSIEQMASDAEALAIEVGFERYHLVGHSMGGAVAQEIALGSPGRLLSLTLEDTAPSFDMARNEVVAKISAMRNEIAEKQGMAALAAIPSPFPRPPHKSEERVVEEAQILARMSVDGFIGSFAGLTTWPGTVDRLASNVTQTLVIYGEVDYPLIEASKRLAKLSPAAVLEAIPEAGHAPQLERPELFNAALRQHLERAAAGTSAK
jgi:pimeloyl-ACP methyl ester carboxylesterase